MMENGSLMTGTAQTPGDFAQDTLKLEYPALSGDIDRALSEGWDRDDLRRWLAEREVLAATQYSPEEIDSFLGRNAKSRAAFWDAMRSRNDDAYVRIMRDSMSERKVRDILNTARFANLPPGLLLLTPELLPTAEKIAGKRLSTFGKIMAAAKNAVAGYKESSASAERMEAEGLRQIKEKGGPDAAMAAYGLRALPEKGETPKQMIDRTLDAEIARLIKSAEEREKSAADWRVHARPSDSDVGAFLLSAIENSGMTVMSALRSAPAWTLGGPAGGLLMSAYNTWDESQREAGGVFMEALRRGDDPEKAYEAAIWDRKANIALLGVTNYAGDILTLGLGGAGRLLRGTGGGAAKVGTAAGRAALFLDGGLDSVLYRTAGKITGSGLASRLARGAVTKGIPIVAGAIPEGLEEYGQEWLKAKALGDDPDSDELREAFKMGAGQAVIYSLFGLGASAALRRGLSRSPRRTGASAAMDAEIAQAAELGAKLAHGELSPDDIVAEDPLVFLPRSALSEEVAAALNIEPEEEAEGTEGTAEPNAPAEGEEPDAGEAVVRKSEWDRFAQEHPESAALLKDRLRVGTRGVTAGEQMDRLAQAVAKKGADKLNADTEEAASARRHVNEVLEQLKAVNSELKTPLSEEMMETQSRIYGHYLLANAQRYGVAVDEIHRVNVQRGTVPGAQRYIEDISLYDMQHAKKMSGRPSQNGSAQAEQSWNTGAPDNISVREMVEAVNDAEGRPYLRRPDGETYQQSSPRQSPDYDESDPKTWPPSAERDEAIHLEAWSEFDPDGEIESWPESPEKTEALELQKEYSDIEAWFDEHSLDEVLADEEHNARGVAIEERLRKLGRELKKQKPRGVEKRLSQLIEAEEEAAAREAETYYQSAYQQAEAITREDVEAAHAIPRKSVNDFTPEEIRSTEKWAQKFWAELGVKSPFFRAWFGDWRAKDTTPVEIVAVTGTKEDMKRGEYRNEDTGWNIRVSARAEGEMRAHGRGKNPIFRDALGNIDEAIKNAVLLDSQTRETPKSEKQAQRKIDSAFMHSLYTIFENPSTGERFLGKLMVEELYDQKKGGTNRRIYELKGITQTPLQDNRLTLPSRELDTQSTLNGVSGFTVANLFSIVKENDKDFNPKDPSGVLDKNGRPLVVYHGTGDKFSEFRRDKLGSRESAFFFTSNKQHAAEYGNTLMPVYLNAKRFIRLDENYVDAEGNGYDVDSPEFREQYDGYSIDEGTRWDEFAVFSPEQMKSASGNMGTFMPGDSNIYRQDDKRGYVEFDRKRQEALINLTRQADASTFLHELWHVGLDDLLTFGRREDAPEQVREDLRTAMTYLGITEADLTDRARMTEAHEKWADAGEAYFQTGKAPTESLQGVFERIRAWLLRIYNGIKDNIELPEDIREVFDRMLATHEEITEAYEVRATVGELAVEKTLLRERIDELEKQEAELGAQIDKLRGKMDDMKARRRQALETQRAKIRERAERLRRKRTQKRKLRRKILQMVRHIEAAAEDGKVIWHRQIEIRDKLKGLDLKFRTKKTIEERREIAEYLATHPEAAEDMKPGKLKYLGTTTLGEIGIKDLWALHSEIMDLRALGRRELEAKKLLTKERIDKARDEIMGTLLKRRKKAPSGAVAGREDLGKQYRGVRGAFAKVMDWTYANTLGAQRYFDHLDGHRGTYDGPWVRLFVDQANAARDNELRHIFRRRESIEKEMLRLHLSLKDLGRTRDVPGVLRRNGNPWTVDELLSIYAGMKNERSREAILYGNFKDSANREAAAAACIEALTDEEKALGDAVIRDYEINFDRINSALIEVYNKGMDHEENYTPMRRLEYTTAEGLMDSDSSEALISARMNAGGMGHVERGFQQSRQAIAQKNQKGIELGLLSIWNSQVEVQEHAAAFAPLLRDLRRILTGRRSAEDDRTVSGLLKEIHGQAAWLNTVNYYNILVRNDTKLAHDVLDSASKYMARNMSAAYLWGSLGTILKQTTSYPRFLPYCGPTPMLAAIAEFSANPKAFLDWCYEQDPQLKARQGNVIMSALKSHPEGLQGAYGELLRLGFEPIALMDRMTAAIGWKAVYSANIKAGLSNNAAVREAQRAVLLTQQATHAKDMPRIWQQSGYVKLAMIFTSEAAQTFGITLYDMNAAIRRGDVPRFLATLLSVTLTAVMMRLLTEGPPDDDTPEGWLRWCMAAVTRQSIEALPLVGKEALTLWDGRSGYFGNAQSAFVAPFAKLVGGARGLLDDKEDNDERAIYNLAEGSALLVPIPVTGTRRFIQAIRDLGEGNAKDALKRMIGMRIEDKRLKRRAAM